MIYTARDLIRFFPYRHVPTEFLGVYYLTEGNALLTSDYYTSGLVSHVSYSPRQIAEKAARLHARKVVLIHNHPLGTLGLSALDKEGAVSLQLFLIRSGCILYGYFAITRNSYVEWGYDNEGIGAVS